MANTITSDISALIPAIIAEAMFVAEEKSLMRGLVRNFAVPAGSGLTVTVPIYPKQTAYNVAENVDLVSNAIVTTSQTITCSEKGLTTTITDLSANSAQANVVADVGRLFGEAISQKIDKDLTALFDGFSTSIGANVAITSAHVFQAVANLKNAGVDPNGVVCVINPMIGYDLLASLTTNGNTPFNGTFNQVANDALRSGFVGYLAGIPVFQSSNVGITAGVSKGGVFHREALGLAMMQDMKIELQRDASLRATELVATAVYGVKELYDGYGVELHNLSSIA